MTSQHHFEILHFEILLLGITIGYLANSVPELLCLRGSTSTAPARDAFLIVVVDIRFMYGLIEAVWQRDFSSDTILIHVTDMFVLKTIYQA